MSDTYADSGSYTPSTLDMRRRLALSMLQQGGQTGPVGSWTQGLSRLVQSMMGGYQLNQLAKDEKAQTAAGNQALLGLLGPDQGAAAPSAAAAPAPSAMPPISAGGPSGAAPNNSFDFTKHEEGLAPVAKWDVRQYSGGYGSKASEGEIFDQAKADAYLKRDMQPSLEWIAKNVPNATPSQKTALADFGYNLGTGRLNELLPDIKAGDWQRVAQRMLSYNKAAIGPGGELQPLDNLTERRQREATLITGAGGAGPAPAQAPQAAAMPSITPEMQKRIGALLANPATRPLGQALIMKLVTQKPAQAEFKQIGTDPATGNPMYGWANPQTMQVTPAQIGGAAQPVSPIDDPALKDLRGNEFLDNVGTAQAERAKNIIAGREAFPAATRGDKTALQVQQLVRRADPDFSANRFAYLKQWQSPNSNIGKTRIANNTAIQHLGELSKLVDSMPDSDMGALSSTSTAMQEWWRAKHNDPVLNDWAANAGTLAGEVVKVNTGAEGSIEDRRRIIDEFSPSKGRAALNAAITKYTKLMAGKTNSLGHDWQKNMGPYADQPTLVDPNNQIILDQLEQKYLGAGEGPPKGQQGSADDALAQAQAAIAKGAPREAVIQRLRSMGIDASGL